MTAGGGMRVAVCKRAATPLRALLLAAVALLPLACATPGERFATVDSALTRDGPEAALSRAESLARGGGNAALDHLHAGMLLHMAGDFEASNERLEAAARRMDADDPFSLTEGLAAVTIAEGVGAFVGQPHERVALHVIRAFNFMAQQQWDAARVEARQIDLRLNALAGRSGFYRDDAFARYVTGLIYEELGEIDDARIAYRKAYRAYDEQRETTGVPVPRPLQQALLRLTADAAFADEHAALRTVFATTPEPAGRGEGGRAIVILGHGLAPRIREISVNAQHPQTGRLYRVAVPAYGDSRQPLRDARVTSGGYEVRAEVVQDIDRLARESLSERMPGILARAATRVAAKNQMVGQARDQNPVLGVLVNLFTFASERVDDRAWTTLPGQYLLAEVPVDDDPATIALELRGPGGRVWREQITDVRVEPGQTRFVFAHALSPHVPLHRPVAGEG